MATPQKKRSTSRTIVRRFAAAALKKKILVIALPVLAVILILAMIGFLAIVLIGAIGGVKIGNEMLYENDTCIDVGSATPRVTTGTPGGGGGAGAPAGQIGMPTDSSQTTLTSGFGMRWGTLHDGVDFAGPVGTPIYAPADGVVTRSGPADGYGNWITIMHNVSGQEVETLYGHMPANGLHVSVGDRVTAGQHIADIGNEGFSTGAHLHFGVYPGGWGPGRGVDPMPWLSQTRAAAAGDAETSPAEDDDTSTQAQTAPAATAAYKPVAVTVSAQTAPAGGGTVTAEDWELLAQCESGGNWAIDTGNGFSGGLQFTQQTWDAFGGTDYAPKASQAGREEQMEVANRVLAEQGWGAWPACSGKLTQLQNLQPAPEGTFLSAPESSKAGAEADPDGDPEQPIELPPFAGGQEDGLQVESIRVMRNVGHYFSTVSTIGGYRPGDAVSGDHPAGRAVDVMIDNWQSPEGEAQGDEIASFLQDHASELGIDYLIWKQAIWFPGNPKGAWEAMEDRGDPTQNHLDHVHVSVTDGGGMPTPATKYLSVGAPSNSAVPGASAPATPSPAEESDLPGLRPYPLESEQLSMQLDVEQQANVKAMISSAKESRLAEEQQPRAAVLAAMLSGQQANFISLTGKDDSNKVGIFADAPRWNKPRARLTDPKMVAGDFYRALLDEYDDDSWMTAPAAEVITRVYSERKSLEVEIAKYESMAADAVAILWDSRGAREGVTLPQVFDRVERCAIGTPQAAASTSGGVTGSTPLRPGAVPAEFEPWFQRAGQECEALSAPVAAAQAFHEGGFRPHAPRNVGNGAIVSGYTQFRAETWQTWGYPVDEQGRPTGPAGTGDPNNIGDAVMAQARYNCANAEMIQGWMDEDRVQGDLTAMMLGAYLAGPGRILQDGGLTTSVSDINGSTPASYANRILEMSKDYEQLQASAPAAEAQPAERDEEEPKNQAEAAPSGTADESRQD